MLLYLLGGEQRALLGAGDRLRRDWYEYGRGVILALDTTTSTVERVADYRPADELDSKAQVLFKGGSVEDGRLYATTMTEVHVYELPDLLRPTLVLSHPWFNDVHHVRPTRSGTLLVANAGLDNCIEMSRSGEVCRVYSVLDQDAWERFDPTIDYRRISTKPHRAHPNQVFFLQEEPWATRFQQKDAVSLIDRGRRIDIGLERVHDGVAYGSYVYFTTVDGKVVVVEAESLSVESVLDLNAMSDREEALGWTRGLFVVDGRHVWVGFSRIRATRFREHLQFVVNGFAETLPTRVALYDLERRLLLQEIDIEPLGMNAVFSLLPGDSVGDIHPPRAGCWV